MFDKHDLYQKRRGGDRPDRYLTIRDSQLDEPFYLTDECGDDFSERVQNAFLAYLTTLGNEGWRLLPSTNSSHPEWPRGTHLLMRQEDWGPGLFPRRPAMARYAHGSSVP